MATGRAGRLPRLTALLAALGLTVIAGAACRRTAADGALRASGYVEATEVRVGPEVGGRVLSVAVEEGDRVSAGAAIATLDTTDTELAIRRVEAERSQADAQLRLLRAGARPEDIRQATAQAESARADVTAAESELRAAADDVARFEALLATNAGSRKQRDDAVTRRDVAAARVQAAKDRGRAVERSRRAACGPAHDVRKSPRRRRGSTPSTRSWRRCGKPSPTRSWRRPSAASSPHGWSIRES